MSFFPPERFHRRHLGDSKRRSWRASRGDPAVVVLRDGIQHATAAQRPGRFQPFRLPAEEQV